MPSNLLAACRWIPWTIALAFVVIAGVNGALAYFAVQSNPGLVSERPYELGTGYNRVLDAAAAQDALGWRGAVQWLPEGGQRGTVAVDLKDAAGLPVAGATLTARLVRPVEALGATDLVLAETGPGRYAAAATPPRPGQWDVRVVARDGERRFQFQQRIMVQ
jgi:nitrogen fixation protein FixH